MSDTPRTDAILALLPGGQSCDPQAVADDLRPEIAKLEREIEQIKAILADPVAVHLNMLRGTIKWTPAHLRHLLGDTTATDEAGDPP